MNAIRHTIVATIAIASCAVHAGPVSVDAACSPRISNLEARLVAKAAQGPDVFRNFVLMRRDIYQLDVRESADRVREIAAARSACVEMASAASKEMAPAVWLK